MSQGDNLLRTRRYSEALERFKREIPRDRQDDFNIGAIYSFGTALLHLGRYKTAEKHFNSLIATPLPMRLTFSLHRIGSGLALWFQGKHAAAVERWKEGLKSRKVGYGGLDVPFLLFYASVRDPKACSFAEAMELIVDRQKSTYFGGDIFLLCHFLRGECTYSETRDLLQAQAIGPYAEFWVNEQWMLVDFYDGLLAHRAGDLDRFYERMLACATITGQMNDYQEFTLAEFEIKHAPAAWKRKYTQWLKEFLANKKGRAASPKTALIDFSQYDQEFLAKEEAVKEFLAKKEAGKTPAEQNTTGRKKPQPKNS